VEATRIWNAVELVPEPPAAMSAYPEDACKIVTSGFELHRVEVMLVAATLLVFLI
jgi:hypothetical protein